MSNQIKDNCVKLVSLINKLESSQNKLIKSQENVKVPAIFGGFARVGRGIGNEAQGNFCIHWNEGDNTVIVEKKNHNNYLITLNPGKTLFKVDNYSLDFKETIIEILKDGPWIERFGKYVEDRIKEVDSLIETEKRMEHDTKFGSIDF